MKTRYLPRGRSAFTLIELLMVIAIIGILATLGIPAISSLTKSNQSGNAVRQLSDDLTIARNKAISERTTVYLVFVPTNFANVTLTETGIPTVDVHIRRDIKTVEKLLDAKYTTYAMFSWRGVGEQPGVLKPHYLTSWRSLPDGTFVAPGEFKDYASSGVNAPGVWKTQITSYGRPLAYDYFPFPSETSDNGVALPYIAFNYLGQLVQPRYLGEPLGTKFDQTVHLADGSILYARDPVTGKLTDAPPEIQEVPPGNSTNVYNRIHIDWLTGRSAVERLEIEN